MKAVFKQACPRRATSLSVLAVAGILVLPHTAAAWDPATTQAGLAEKAAVASNVHMLLVSGLQRPLGLFEPIAIGAAERRSPTFKNLWRRLNSLSGAEGYRPSTATGANPALSWIAAGAALEGVPAERGRHHFFDPTTGKGLHDNPGAAGGVHRLKLALDGAGGLRGLATGSTFDLTGRPAVGWLLADENELGLLQFLAAMERSVAAESSDARQASLAHALMCLGAMGAVLADMGEPAHVRNDFRAAFLGGGTAGSWDQGSDFERFTAQTYGRAGVPDVPAVVSRSSLQSFFSANDGQGLAQRTQSQFFSAGTLPEDVSIDAATTPKKVRDEANQSLRYAQPSVARLQLRDSRRHYQTSNGVRQFAYQRLPNEVHFFLDEAVYGDVSQAWLPVVGGYVAGLYNNLLRVQADVSVVGGEGTQKVTVTVKGLAPGATGTLRMFGEAPGGKRREVGARMALSVSSSGSATSDSPSNAASAAMSFELPPGFARVAVVVQGQDAGGAFVAVAERSAGQGAR